MKIEELQIPDVTVDGELIPASYVHWAMEMIRREQQGKLYDKATKQLIRESIKTSSEAHGSNREKVTHGQNDKHAGVNNNLLARRYELGEIRSCNMYKSLAFESIQLSISLSL